MQGVFLIVIVIVAAVGVLGAVIALATSRRTWESLGRDRLLMESDLRDSRARPAAARRPRASPAGSTGREDERAAEIRQMLEARNARRRRRGEPPLDVDAEVAHLLAMPPTGELAPRSEADRELHAEIRQFVIARNHRRVRRGQPPLDVEAEIARQIARLTG